MTLRNWIIDLRVDYKTERQAELMLINVRAAAKELLISARMLADERAPDIAIQADDIFLGRNEVEMFTQEEKDEYGI
jgi:hypothetical protein